MTDVDGEIDKFIVWKMSGHTRRKYSKVKYGTVRLVCGVVSAALIIYLSAFPADAEVKLRPETLVRVKQFMATLPTPLAEARLMKAEVPAVG